MKTLHASTKETQGPQQCPIGGNRMSMVTHEDGGGIPEGFAALAMDNNGWVGTNNGWPMAGQPALFPIAQAEAITYAWNSALKNIPRMVVNPEAISEEARLWLRWSDFDVQKRMVETFGESAQANSKEKQDGTTG